MSKTINLSHAWVEKSSVDENGNLTLRLEAERGNPSDEVRPKIKVVIHGCCGLGNLVREAMAAHRRKVDRVIGNMNWEIEDIADSVDKAR